VGADFDPPPHPVEPSVGGGMFSAGDKNRGRADIFTTAGIVLTGERQGWI